MQTLTDWATRHHIPPHVLADLLAIMGAGQPDGPPPPPAAGSRPASEAATAESSIQSAVCIEHARRTGGRMMRNNSGTLPDKNGRPVRFGLGNTSTQINKVIKSSDLIGITPVRCPCGHIYGVFTAFEIKAANWKFRQSDDRAVAQWRFGQLVLSLNGIFKFIQSVEDL